MSADDQRDSGGIRAQSELGRRLAIGERLGAGGIGVVHEVVEQNLGKTLAIKFLREGHIRDRGARQRLIDEARITARLDHPGIVPVHELSADRDGDLLEPGALYFTMKRVRGRTLAQLFADTRFPDRDPRQLFEQLQILVKVCDALAFAHSEGVVHRDLKPANVMLGEYGEVYLMDWGIARDVDAGRGDVGVAGTPAYMAPEQARGDVAAIDERTDVFALGAVLHEMITGEPPYVDEQGHEEALHFKAMVCEIEPLAGRASFGAPPRLCRIADRALAADPAARHQSVAELRGELEELLRSGFQFERERYRPGELIVVEGQPGDTAYVIAEGSCRAFKTVDGEKSVLREMGPGDVFGETAVFSERPRTASVEAIDEATVMVLDGRQLERDLGLGFWIGRFVRALAARFAERDARVTDLEQELARRSPPT